MSRVCALLCWYDESPRWLAATIASLAGVADHLVAVDGAYALLPDGRADSPLEQRTAIVELAAAARIPLTLHVPAETWAGNEIEKRNAALAFAHVVADSPDWWLLVIDADERVTRADGLHAALDGCAERVASCPLVTSAGGMRSTEPQRRLFRANPELRYVGLHYAVLDEDGWLSGDDAMGLDPAARLSRLDFELEHRADPRSRERELQKRTYYQARSLLGIEARADAEVLA